MRHEIVIVSYGRDELLIQNHRVLRQLYPATPVCWGLQGALSHAVREIETNDQSLRIVHRQTPHITATLNDCLGSSNAEIVLLLDDDAVPCPGWLEMMDDVFTRHQGLVYCMGREIRLNSHFNLFHTWLRLASESIHRVFVPQSALSSGRIIGWMTRTGFIIGNFDLSGNCRINSPRGCNMALDRKAALALGGFEEAFRGNHWGFETEFGLRAQAAGHLGYFCGQAVVLHAQTASGGTRSASSWSSLSTSLHNHRLLIRHVGPLAWLGAIPRLARTLYRQGLR